jgi:cold shock protein
MSEGIVKWFDKKKGYGFVEHNNKDIFIHHSSFIGKFNLNDHDLISFDIVDGEKGLKAINITKAG